MMSSETAIRYLRYIQPPTRALQRQIPDDSNSQAPQRWYRYPIVYLSNASQPQVTKRTVWTRRLCVALQIFGGIAFIITCITLRPTLTSAADTRKATQLAQWTTAKEFLEFCEFRGFNTTPCLSAQNVTLSEPPGFSVSKLRRSLSNITLRSTLRPPPPGLSFMVEILLSMICLVIAAIIIINHPKTQNHIQKIIRSLGNRRFSPSTKRIDVGGTDSPGTRRSIITIKDWTIPAAMSSALLIVFSGVGGRG
ncbi:hypothetical protein QBC43DRAFT_132986 [Cladorrhinum sp. PSN259]|nr:hypothetical protein QBC43DRAFT_132986 [Cladorrhinum sp. PSN259]